MAKIRIGFSTHFSGANDTKASKLPRRQPKVTNNTGPVIENTIKQSG